MHVGGFIPFTLTDYPGEIAAVVFTQGCNFSCPFCHNKALVAQAPPGAAGEEAARIFEFLEGRKGRLGAVVISGGEPTLQLDLQEFIKGIRPLGYKVKLDTNGSRPWVLKGLLDKGFLDMVAMDIKAPWDKYQMLAGRRVQIEDIQASLELILASKIEYIFRTTLVPGMLSLEDTEKIRQMLPPSARYVVQPYVRPGQPPGFSGLRPHRAGCRPIL